MIRGMLKRTKSFCLTLCFIMALLPAAEMYAGTVGNVREAALYNAGNSGKNGSASSDMVMYPGEKLTIKPVSGNGKAKWTSDDKKTVKVGKKNGKATARKVGETNIRAVFESGITEVFHVTVKEAELDKPELMTEPGSSGTITFNGGKIKKVNSGDESVISVVKDGTDKISYKAGKTGDTEITVTGKPKKGKKKVYTCKVSVRNSYTVTFESNGGSAVPAQKVFDGMIAKKPADPVKEGFSFDGWNKDSELSEKYDFNEKITGNLTLYASWLRENGGTESGNKPENADPENGGENGENGGTESGNKPENADPENGGENGENGDPQNGGESDDVELNYDEMVGGGSDSDPAVDVFAIDGLEIMPGAGKAKAKISSSSDSILKVRFIDEEIYFSEDYPENKKYIQDGALYAEKAVPGNTDLEYIEADILGDLPEYYVAEAVLTDDEGNELCNPYSNIEHTVRYGEYAAKTVNDFGDDDVVLNFDDQDNDNFAVLEKDIKVVSADSAEPVYGNAGDGAISAIAYRLVNPSEKILEGDKVYFSNDDGGYILRVKEIKKEGDVTILYPADPDDPEYGYSIADFYQFMKVHMEAPEEESEIERSGEEPEVDIYKFNIKLADVTTEKSFTYSLPFDFDKFSITGSLGGKISTNIVIEWDAHLFGKDYFKCNVKITTEASLKVKISAEKDLVDHDWKDITEEIKEAGLGELRIPVGGVPGLEAVVKIDFKTKLKISADLSTEVKFKCENGFNYSTKDGYEPINKKEASATLEAKGSAELTIGPTLSAGVEYLRCVKAHVEVFAGAKVSGEAKIPLAQTGPSSIHACGLCAEIEVKKVFEVSLKLFAEIKEIHIKGDLLDLKLKTVEEKLFDCYCSIRNDTDSMFEGKFHAGLGTCPNNYYKVNIYTRDSSDKEVNAEAAIKNTTKNLDRNRIKGGGYGYLPPASYTATATINGKTVKKSFTVVDKEITVTLKEGEGDPDPGGGGGASENDPGGGSTSENDPGGGGSTSLNTAEYNVTLSWPENIDLDLMVEFEEPGQTEYDDDTKIYFNHKSAKYKDGTSAGSLNGDSRSAGSETINFTARENTQYVCYVKISDPMNADISGYSPSLTVKKDGVSMGSFSVPSGSGNYWDVFLITDGDFSELGDLSYEEDTDSGK